MQSRPTQDDFRRSLADAGLLIATGRKGLYLRGGQFETLTRQLEAYFQRLDPSRDYADLVAPPVIARSTLESTGYVNAFPNLVGGVVSEDSDGGRSDTDAGLALSSAVCHAVYPTVDRAPGVDGSCHRISGFVFRHEPSDDPMRMISFRMHETVYVGESVGCEEVRDLWLGSAVRLLGALGLRVEVEAAFDPFLGRTGRLLASRQLAEQLKFEITVPALTGRSMAIASSNLHRDHFGKAFNILTETGNLAHSTCLGFGVERVALALICEHGLDIDSWDEAVTRKLG